MVYGQTRYCAFRILKVKAKSFDRHVNGKGFSHKMCIMVAKFPQIKLVGLRPSKLLESDVCWQSMAPKKFGDICK